MLMRRRSTRRTLLRATGGAPVALGLRSFPRHAQSGEPVYSYPMGLPGQSLGDGLFVRIAYAAENVRYYPGWWHTGENWHRSEGVTAGMAVYAVAAGAVVYADFDYPGRVVIVQHDDGLFAMYGHLDSALTVEPGQEVTRGQRLGTVLARSDDLERSHLHFELRTFFTRPEVNGDAPQYGVSCGYACPPGPGYWPMAAPRHPSDLGWRNPTHVIARRAWPDGMPDGTEVVVASGAATSAPLWTMPADVNGAERLGELPLAPGGRHPLLAIAAGEEDALATSAAATRLWYRIALGDGTPAWVQAAVPLALEAGNDGRPSSVRLVFLPAIAPSAT